MCGLAGILRLDDTSPDRDRLDATLAHLLPRGPDGHGVEIDGPCGMAHTRLSIIDLLGGDQPMRVPARDGDGSLALMFNGEIYNHRALRDQLEGCGHRFTSDHCDTEVLLHGYREWGTELPKHLHGMYAFAVWDADRHQVFMVRDRVGKKPLYVYHDARQIVYGSLIGAVIAAIGRTPEIHTEAINHYLTFGYTGGKSMLRGIEEMPAAHWMLIDTRGSMRTERYWRPPPLSRSSTKLGAQAAVHEVLTEAVTARLESDVPLGCFLSGGIDSSLIAAIAQRHIDQPLKTFNVAMPDARYDESPYARQVAQHIGAEHHVLEARPMGSLFDDLERLTAGIGEPLADSSILPTYWLCRATREHVSVALSGDGGDELFGGYDRYRAMRLLRRFRGMAQLIPHWLLRSPEYKSQRARLSRLAAAARHDQPGSQYLQMIRLFTPQQIGRLGLGGFAMDVPPAWRDEADPAESARFWDLDHYLPYDLLRKVDRASMSVALEVRSPMLDTQLCDLAGHLPLRVLLPGGKPKGLLRQVAAKYLPSAIVRRRKSGFSIPIGAWFAGALADQLRERLLDGHALEELGVRRDTLERMIEEHAAGRINHSPGLFALLTLSMWLNWIRDPAPPIADVLAAARPGI
ncbi:MAG: asparagine synthase (glutamine-hydrolyzing) [Planctomycetaceae bacterium]|nr:asparagine synthase (glutamine-hydrolyzing) [Planctomycetaceae bacterium]